MPRFTVALALLALLISGLAPTLPAATTDWSISLRASLVSPTAWEPTFLTATANRDVAGSGFAIHILDATRGALVATCASGATCTANFSLPEPTPLEHRFLAYVAAPAPAHGTPPSPPDNVQAASSPVTVQWSAPWRPAATGTSPGGRFGAAMAFDPAEGVTVLFGGCRALTRSALVVGLNDNTTVTLPDGGYCRAADNLGDTWLWDGATEAWTPLAIPGPPARWSAGMAYDYASRRVVLFGGLYQTNGTGMPDAVERCFEEDTNAYGVPGVAWLREDSANGRDVTYGCFGDTWLFGRVGGTWQWQRVTADGSPSARFDAAMAFDAAGRPTLIGGCHRMGMMGGHGSQDQAKVWDCTGYGHVEKEFFLPGGRCAPDMQYLKYNPAAELCLEKEVENTDAWRLTWSAPPEQGGQASWVPVGCLDEDVRDDGLCAPGELRGASAAFDPATRRIVLFGGYYYEPRFDYGGFQGDTWEFDGASWMKSLTAGAFDQWCPSRSAQKAWGAAAPARLGGSWQVLHVGGYGRYFSRSPSCDLTRGDARQDPYFTGTTQTATGIDRPLSLQQAWADTWRWDGAARAARECPAVGSNTMCWQPIGDGPFAGRSSASIAYDHIHGKVVLAGGLCTGCTQGLGDTWVLAAGAAPDPCGNACGTAGDTFHGSWVAASPTLAPSARWGASSASLPERNVTALFGGCTAGNPCTRASSETWLWDGSAWAQSLAPGPPARFAAAFAYDASDHVLVLHGGLSAQGALLSDTWTFDGMSWSEVLGPGPAGRAWHGLATEPSGGVLLFGGCDLLSGWQCSHFSGETWRWRAGSWSKACTTAVCAATPSARMVTGQMAAAADGHIVLWGGFAGSPLGDAWTWNGTSWSSLAAQGVGAGPTARSGANLVLVAHDGSRALFLFGGSDASGLRQDIWRLDLGPAGAAWSEHACGCGGPSHRQTATFAAQPGGGAVLFGGLTGGSAANGETWTFVS